MTAENRQQAFHTLGDASFYMTDYHFNEVKEKNTEISGHTILRQRQDKEASIRCSRLTVYFFLSAIGFLITIWNADTKSNIK